MSAMELLWHPLLATIDKNITQYMGSYAQSSKPGDKYIVAKHAQYQDAL